MPIGVFVVRLSSHELAQSFQQASKMNEFPQKMFPHIPRKVKRENEKGNLSGDEIVDNHGFFSDSSGLLIN